MKRKRLVILCGVPGSGKSTWVRGHLSKGDIYVSRDEIRYSIVSSDEDYFSHEVEVYDKFVAEINENLNKGLRVFADATHINWASRRKLIERIQDREFVDIDTYVFNTSLKLCIKRNNQRKGRECVPENVVRDMYSRFRHPTTDYFKYKVIKNIYPNGREEDIKDE